nr:reverse transcriptase domain-containing protein [Tanacetum cinerariifolium]
MIRGGENHKRPFEGEWSGLTHELTYTAIPQNRLTDEPIILEGRIEDHRVRRILVDGRSSSEIMCEHCFRNLNVNIRSRLRRCRAPLIGFSGKTYHPLGVIDLRVTMRETQRNKTVLMEFSIVKCCSPYNVIIGRTGMRSLRATVGKGVRFLEGGTVASSEEKMSRIREQAILRTKNSSGYWPNQDVLQENMKVFTWGGSERTDVPRFVMEHQLKIHPFTELMVHKRRPMTPDGRHVLKERVLRWLKEGMIRKIQHPE